MKSYRAITRRARLTLYMGLFALHGITTLMASSHLIFLGTYTRTGDSKGIYSVRLDDETGILTAPELVAEAIDPAWIALSPDKKILYAIHASPAQALAFKVDSTMAKLSPLKGENSSPGSNPISPPSHLAVDASGRVLLAANYRDGFVAAVPIQPNGALGAANIIKHDGKGPHPTRQEK